VLFDELLERLVLDSKGCLQRHLASLYTKFASGGDNISRPNEATELVPPTELVYGRGHEAVLPYNVNTINLESLSDAVSSRIGSTYCVLSDHTCRCSSHSNCVYRLGSAECPHIPRSVTQGRVARYMLRWVSQLL